MWKHYNPNPKAGRVGDCSVRALCLATDKSWEEVYSRLATIGFVMADMPSANSVWGAFLKENGYKRKIISDECPDCYTVEDFARENPKGKYVLGLSGHVVAVYDGDWYDTWNSGSEIPIYYWYKEEEQ